MKTGKLSETVFARSVLRQLHTARPEVLVAPGIGRDGSAIETGGRDVVCAVGTMSLALSMQVPIAVYTACNNILCLGAEPVGILLSLMLPTEADEQKLRDRMSELEELCARERIQVLGGHTEVTRAVAEQVFSVTAVGSVSRGAAVAGRVEPGMDIVMAGWAGLAGTAILAREREEELRGRYAQAFVEQAKERDVNLSVRAAALAAVQSGASALHDGSWGGIMGALWELGEGSGVGLEIDLKEIPIRQETVEVCEFFHINPYKLLSTGSLLIAAKDGEAVAGTIRRTRGNAVVIGKATSGNDRVLLCGEERRFMELPQSDELYKIIRS